MTIPFDLKPVARHLGILETSPFALAYIALAVSDAMERDGEARAPREFGFESAHDLYTRLPRLVSERDVRETDTLRRRPILAASPQHGHYLLDFGMLVGSAKPLVLSITIEELLRLHSIIGSVEADIPQENETNELGPGPGTSARLESAPDLNKATGATRSDLCPCRNVEHVAADAGNDARPPCESDDEFDARLNAKWDAIEAQAAANARTDRVGKNAGEFESAKTPSAPGVLTGSDENAFSMSECPYCGHAAHPDDVPCRAKIRVEIRDGGVVQGCPSHDEERLCFCCPTIYRESRC